MNTDTIIRLLSNAGFHNVGADASYIYMEDPACILRSFETFIEYAWVIIVFVTGMFLFGWGLSLIRGAKTDGIFMNLRNLVLIFGALSAVWPILNAIHGGDVFTRGCNQIKIPLSEINKVLDMRKLTLTERDEYDLYEELNISDTGALPMPTDDTPQAPVDMPTESVGPSATSSDGTVSPASPVNVADVPTRATESGKDVIYTLPNGIQQRRSGGTRAWRNSNPGNIRSGSFARRVGAIGQAGGFAVFPDEATGMYAIKALLRTSNYNSLTIAGAISRYAPPSENDTAAYHRRLEQLTGLSINRPMSGLSDAELERVAFAIRTIEGWEVGNVQQI